MPMGLEQWQTIMEDFNKQVPFERWRERDKLRKKINQVCSGMEQMGISLALILHAHSRVQAHSQKEMVWCTCRAPRLAVPATAPVLPPDQRQTVHHAGVFL